MATDPDTSGRRPILEPEILPPERSGGQDRFRAFEFRIGEGSFNGGFVRISPWRAALWGIAVLAAAALLLFLFASALLVLLPAAVLAFGGAVVWLRLKRWWLGRG